MQKINYFGNELTFADYSDILEQIKKDINKKANYTHVVSLNTETSLDLLNNREFKEVATKARLVIADGSGVVTAIQMLYGEKTPRVTGTDLMVKVLETLLKERLTVCFIGGKGKVAENLAECYSIRSRYAKFFGLSGYHDILNPKKEEENEICSIVSSLKPRFVFVAFGSPQQEIWIERHKDLFKDSFVMGVGGAFDFIVKKVPRAPQWMRDRGLEWLFRLVREPWRIKRQWKLPVFFCIVLYYKALFILGLKTEGRGSR